MPDHYSVQSNNWCKKTGRCKNLWEKHGHLECSMDMESRKIIGQKVLVTKKAIFKAKNAERKKFCEDLDREDGKDMCLG